MVSIRLLEEDSLRFVRAYLSGRIALEDDSGVAFASLDLLALNFLRVVQHFNDLAVNISRKCSPLNLLAFLR